MHTGVNAVMEAAKLIDWANQENARSQHSRHSDVAQMFDPPWTTLHVGTITGGTAENITAKECRFALGIRSLPDEDPEDWSARYLIRVAELEAEMQKIHPEARIDTRVTTGVPGLRPEENGAAETLARRLTGDNGSHAVSYATEGGQFQEGGYSAVICGPGNIEQAHQANEYLELSEFRAGEAFIDKLVHSLTQ
jgi:acetylornithine deacetylase